MTDHDAHGQVFHCPKCFSQHICYNVRDYSVLKFGCCGVEAVYIDPAESKKRAEEAKHLAEAPERKAFCRAYVIGLAPQLANGDIRDYSEAFEMAREAWAGKPEDL